jgi:hypothetical protein
VIRLAKLDEDVFSEAYHGHIGEIALYGPRGVASPAALAVKTSLLGVLSSGIVPERAAA